MTLDWVALPLSATGGQSIHFLLPFCALAHEDIEKKCSHQKLALVLGFYIPGLWEIDIYFFFKSTQSVVVCYRLRYKSRINLPKIDYAVSD